METNNHNYLLELKGSKFEIAENEPDIRGWEVIDNTRSLIGEVEELIFDVESQKVRYMVIDLKRNAINLKSRTVLVPIGLAEIEEDRVLLPTVTANHLSALPLYKKGSINHTLEASVRNIFSNSTAGDRIDEQANTTAESYNAEFYNHPHFKSDSLKRTPSNRTSADIPKLKVEALFENRVAAENGVFQLNNSGFKQETLYISGSDTAEDNRGMSHFFSKMTDESENGKRYRSQDSVKEGNTVVVVNVASRDHAREAVQILKKYGAIEIQGDVDVRSSDQESEVKWNQPENNLNNGTHGQITNDTFRGDKQDGLTEQLNRSDERRLEHNTNTSTLSKNNLGTFTSGTIEITENTEVPIIKKEARVVEEVSLDKEAQETEIIIKDNLKQTKVDIEDLPPSGTTNDNNSKRDN